ncbi:MAG TPA: alpha/beta fold hydrolase [Syntrophales bacterium]|nr:alpha/beta fold hydrolase [Syntrophales bacterium]
MINRTEQKTRSLMWWALILILIGGLLAWWIQTDGGKIKIKDVRFVGSDGRLVSALLYIPPGVSSKNPAPGIVATHGYINSRETQDGFAIEFARRGYVVLAPDQSGHGFSDPPAFAAGFGGLDTLKYLRTLDIVDKDNIGLEGHSMGGWASVIAAKANPDGYKSIVLMGSSTGTYGAPDGTPTFPRNLLLVFSLYDEFSWLMWGPAVPKDIVKTDKLKKLFNTTENVIPGKLYGSIEEGTARKLMQPPIIHPRDHFSREAIGYAVEWMQQTLKGGKSIPPSNQVWYWKELGNLIALIGMVLFIFPLGERLLATDFFQELKSNPPEAKSLRGFGWWIGAFLLVFIPLPLYLWAIGLSAPPGIKASACWPQNVTTIIMYWALASAAVSIILFLLWHFLLNRTKGGNFVAYGARWQSGGETWRKIFKSLLLAIVIAFGAYVTLAISNFLFKTDYRLWVFAVKPMTSLHLRIFLSYIIPFMAFFLILGLILHGQLRKDTWRPWQEMVINVVLLIIGYVIFELFQYLPLFGGGSLAIPQAALWFIVMFQFFPLFIIAALVMTYFFRRTGHIYAGSFLAAILITWIVVASQATHFAF